VCEQVGHDGAFDEGGSVHAGILHHPGQVVNRVAAEINFFIPGIFHLTSSGICGILLCLGKLNTINRPEIKNPA
jgi:hypothetical protein